MEGYSQTPKEERINALKSIMPEIFDEGKIDWEKLRETLGENANISDERYVLNWAGKGDAFRAMQQHTSATLVPCREESVDFDNTQNIFIEGENMEVLKVLQKSYFGKVKMIYIDPPYNTGNDSFIYPDKFSEKKSDYLQRVGDKDENGYMTREGMFHKNSKENGQYHSNWLSMMMPRLYLAKSLLRDDGVIFISIDDNEVYNLRLLMNEIFGEENFEGQLVIKTATDNNPSQINTEHEYMVCYAKNKAEQNNWMKHSDAAGLIVQQYLNLKRDCSDINEIQTKLRSWIKTNKGILQQVAHYNNVDEKGVYSSSSNSSNPHPGGYMFDIIHPVTGLPCPKPMNGWRWTEKTFQEYAANGEIEWGKDHTTQPHVKKRIDTCIEFLRSLIYEDNRGTTKKLSDLFDGHKVFDNPKPINVLSNIFDFVTDKDSIVLDFFAGSGTTAHAVIQLNAEDGGSRKFICVQLPELCDEKSEAYKAGYKTIAEISKERIRRASKKIRNEIETERDKQKGELPFDGIQNTPMPDLGFKVFKLSESNFKQWNNIKNVDEKKLNELFIKFSDPVAENATTENMIYELLLKCGKDLNSKIEHINEYHAINDRELVLMLESISQEAIDSIITLHPNKVIALDRLFEGNDQMKTNTALQMRDAGIEFKTI
ncbi:MAG: site-specific DNA-methyltransferase [Prevotella sp.]|nr:site-specific DNA-methyltransferase [Prevotella sp.]